MNSLVERWAKLPHSHTHQHRMLSLLEGLIADGCVWTIPDHEETFDVWDRAALADLAEANAIDIDTTDPELLLISVGSNAEPFRLELIDTQRTTRPQHRTTAMQDDILKVLREARRPLIAKEVTDRLQKAGLGCSHDWVKRNLAKLVSAGRLGNRRKRRGSTDHGYYIIDA